MLELSARVKNVIHLEQGEPDFVTPGHILDAAVQAAKKGFTHYTEIDGTMELREAIAEKLARENGIDVDPANRGHGDFWFSRSHVYRCPRFSKRW